MRGSFRERCGKQLFNARSSVLIDIGEAGVCYLRKGETKDAKWKRTQGPLHAEEAFPVLQDSEDSAEPPNGLMFVKPTMVRVRVLGVQESGV